LGVWAAPGGRETFQKGGGRSPPPFWKVSRWPGAAQTPQNPRFPVGQKNHTLKTQMYSLGASTCCSSWAPLETGIPLDAPERRTPSREEKPVIAKDGSREKIYTTTALAGVRPGPGRGAGVGFLCGFYQVRRLLRPPRRGAAGGAVLPDKNRIKIDSRTPAGPRPDPGRGGGGVYFPGSHFRDLIPLVAPERLHVKKSLWVLKTHTSAHLGF